MREGRSDVRLLNTKASLAYRFLSVNFPPFFSADSHERALKEVFIRGLVVLCLVFVWSELAMLSWGVAVMLSWVCGVYVRSELPVIYICRHYSHLIFVLARPHHGSCIPYTSTPS